MTIEVVAFIIGGILIGTAIVGGGFEIKEIKMPRVGAGVRIVSLVVGSGFILLAMGIWGVNNPNLIANTPATSALAPEPQGQAPSAEVGDESDVDAVDPRSAVNPQPVVQSDPQVPAEAGFGGFTGDSYLSWEIQGVPVSASARFAGMGGMIRIAWQDPATGVREEILQDLALVQDRNGTIFYQGANPRDAATEQLRPEYNPDQFRVVQSGGQWTIDQICDVQACWPVTVR